MIILSPIYDELIAEFGDPFPLDRPFNYESPTDNPIFDQLVTEREGDE